MPPFAMQLNHALGFTFHVHCIGHVNNKVHSFIFLDRQKAFWSLLKCTNIAFIFFWRIPFRYSRIKRNVFNADVPILEKFRVGEGDGAD